MEEEERAELARAEAVLFLMKEPCSSRKLAQLSGVSDSSRARALVRLLNERYQRNGYSFCVVEVAGGFQLRALPEFAPWLMRLQEFPLETRLTRSAMETLAIIAYEQPILRANIERIRGVHCGEILRQLLEQNLIRIAGRSEELGRPFLYGTTKRFLQLFGLMRLEDLPRRHYAWASATEANEIAEEIVAYDRARANQVVGAAEDGEEEDGDET